jgi:hypothetical protein
MRPEEKNRTGENRGGDVKCLEECPKCKGEGETGHWGYDTGHSSAHRCNRCNNTWEREMGFPSFDPPAGGGGGESEGGNF